ncbi:MAG: hypothetical protein WBP18_04350, partial [Paracoccaceae bacterium]
MARSPALQAFLDQSAVDLAAATEGRAARAAEAITRRLAAGGKAVTRAPEVLAVCDWIGPALA